MRFSLWVLLAGMMVSAHVWAEEILPLETRLENIDRSCFERDWDAVECEFESENNYTTGMGVYERTPVIDDLGTIILSVVKRFGIDSSIYYIRRFAAEFGISADDAAIQKRLNFVKLQMDAAKVAKQKKLSACKRACLANCIAAHSMTYVGDSNARSLVPADSLARGYGLCQHYSTMASFLSHYLGNQNTVAVASVSMGHQFVATQINGRWWYSEPQSDRCRFFPAKYREFPGLK